MQPEFVDKIKAESGLCIHTVHIRLSHGLVPEDPSDAVI